MGLLSGLWYWIIGFCVMMYVLLDGFDLGVGILFPLFPQHKDRDVMMSTILPVWDGNQTWLVLGGASLYGAFPAAFSLLLPTLYLPVFVIVLALLFRGITLEFRLKATRALRIWEGLFFLSSIVVAFSQGLVLGTFVKGFEFVSQGQLLNYGLFTPFNITCGIAVIFGYTLLGSTWIISKTTGSLQKKMYQIAPISLLVVSFFLLVVSLWTPFIDISIREVWFNPNYIYILALLPITSMVLIAAAAFSLYKRYEYIIFWLCLGIFMCAYAGVGISTWPYLVPHLYTVAQMAAPDSSLIIMLVGAIILLPVLLGYTLYSYYIFRGKVEDVIGYH